MECIVKIPDKIDVSMTSAEYCMVMATMDENMMANPPFKAQQV